jgi:hypothetical protein
MATTQSGNNMSMTNGNPTIMRSNLLMAVKMYDEKPKLAFYNRIAGKILTTEQAYEETALVSGLMMPKVTDEYGPVPVDDITSPYWKRHKPEKRTLQFRVSDEAFINDRYGIMKSYGTLLKSAFDQAREVAAAVFLNSCTSPSLISTPAGQPLSSASHPLDASASPNVDANTFVTQQTLGVIALEDAAMGLRNQRAHKGYPSPKVPPFVLEVATRNGMVAKRLVAAGNLPTTNNNDKNVIANDVADVIVSPYFTNPEWWSLRCQDDSQHRRFMLQRYKFKLMPIVYDEDTDSWKITAKECYLFDVADYRGVWYSTPA